MKIWLLLLAACALCSPSFGLAIEPSSAAQITGHVIFPEGVPDDEVCEVVLYGTRSTSSDEYGYIDWFDWSARPEDFEFARVGIDVNGDGAFVLPMPSNPMRLYLAARGRYLRTVEGPPPMNRSAPQEIPRDEWHLPQVLKPQLGAWLTVVLVAPEKSVHDPSVLVGRSFRLTETRWAANSFVPVLLGRIGLDLKAQFYGLNTGVAHHAEGGQALLAWIAPFIGSGDLFLGMLSGGGKLAPGQHLEIEVPLVDGKRLVGRLVDGAGNGLAGAWIGLGRDRDSLRIGYSERGVLVTDEEGRFDLDGVPISINYLSVVMLDSQRLVLSADELGNGHDRPEKMLVMERGRVIAGQVHFEDGKPAGGVYIRLVPVNDGSNPNAHPDLTGNDHVFRGRSAEDGQFEIKGLALVEYDLHATVDDQPSSSPQAVRALRADRARVLAGTRGLDLLLAPTPALTVRAVDETGGPVTDYFLYARRYRIHADTGEPVPYEYKRRAHAGSAPGALAWEGLAPGNWFIWTSKSDLKSERVSVTLDGNPQAVELMQPCLGSFAGRVKTEEKDADRGKLTVVALLEVAGKADVEIARSACSADGSFEFKQMRPGEYHLHVIGPKYGTGRPFEVRLGPAKVLDGLMVEAWKKVFIDFEVRRTNMELVAGAQLVARQKGTLNEPLMAETDAKGLVRIGPLVQGAVTLEISVPSSGPHPAATFERGFAANANQYKPWVLRCPVW